MKHTPGEWQIRATFNDGGQECLAVGKPHQWPEGELAWAAIATLPPLGVGPFGEDMRANARLIAAAPELLRLCGAAVAALRSYQFGNTSPDLAAEVADAIEIAATKISKGA